VIQDVVADISPRLIVGKNVYRTEPKTIRDLITRVAAAASELELSGKRS
jgi:hypothetical protein